MSAPRVVGYVRVSTDEQAEHGHSLDAQREAVGRYTELYGLRLVGVVEDPGASAKTLRRPGVVEVLRRLDDDPELGLVVWRLDRLTRSVHDLTGLVGRYFRERPLHSVMEHIDTTTAAGRMLVHVLGSFAEYERELIAERTRDAMRRLKTLGVPVGRPASPERDGYEPLGSASEDAARLGLNVSTIRRWRARRDHDLP